MILCCRRERGGERYREIKNNILINMNINKKKLHDLQKMVEYT